MQLVERDNGKITCLFPDYLIDTSPNHHPGSIGETTQMLNRIISRILSHVFKIYTMRYTIPRVRPTYHRPFGSPLSLPLTLPADIFKAHKARGHSTAP